MLIQHPARWAREPAAAGHRPPQPEECARLGRDGYLVVRGFVQGGQLAELLRWTTALEHASVSSGAQWVYGEDSLRKPGQRLLQRIENFCPYHEGFDQFVRYGPPAQWTAALLGGPAVLFKDKINFKMPGGSGFEPHQDQQAGWSRYAPLFMTAMLSLDEATLENGCLEIAPGRHREGLIGEMWTPLTGLELGLRPVPTAPGDAIFFDSFVPHASKPNLTGQSRRILYLTYNLASEGDHRARYFTDKHAAFPPDVDRSPDRTYVFRV